MAVLLKAKNWASYRPDQIVLASLTEVQETWWGHRLWLAGSLSLCLFIATIYILGGFVG